jgi:hypothetical protein
MVQERHDRLDAAGAQPFQTRSRPGEIVALPKDRIPARRDAQVGDQIDVVGARVVAGLGKLIADRRRIDPRNRRLGTRPEFDRAK